MNESPEWKEALDKFRAHLRRTTPDPERGDFKDTLSPDGEADDRMERLNQALDHQFGEIRNVSIGK